MKFNLKAVSVAVAMMVAGTANAAIDTFETGDSELFFSVRDNSTTSPQSYVADLNVNLSAWDGNSDFTFSDALLADFLSTGSGDYSYAIQAGDNIIASMAAGELNYLTTASDLAETAIAGMTGSELFNLQAMNTYILDANQALMISGGDSAVVDGSSAAFFTTQMDKWDTNTPFVATASLGEALSFYHVTDSENFYANNNALVNVTKYAGTWNLDASGTLTYSVGGAPVPVPAAIWLLGSAMVGLVGVARRKQA
jgi:hypothetical protein